MVTQFHAITLRGISGATQSHLTLRGISGATQSHPSSRRTSRRRTLRGLNI